MPRTKQPPKCGPKPVKMPTFPSMRAMSGATGIPIDWLQDSKDKGCPAFRQNNSVELEGWLRWFCAQEEGEDADAAGDAPKWSDKYSRVKTWIAEIELQKKRNEVVERAKVQEALTNGMAVFRGEVERIFCTELPPALKGLSELEIQRRCVAEITRLMDSLREKLARLEDSKKEEVK